MYRRSAVALLLFVAPSVAWAQSKADAYFAGEYGSLFSLGWYCCSSGRFQQVGDWQDAAGRYRRVS